MTLPWPSAIRLRASALDALTVFRELDFPWNTAIGHNRRPFREAFLPKLSCKVCQHQPCHDRRKERDCA